MCLNQGLNTGLELDNDNRQKVFKWYKPPIHITLVTENAATVYFCCVSSNILLEIVKSLLDNNTSN